MNHCGTFICFSNILSLKCIACSKDSLTLYMAKAYYMYIIYKVEVCVLTGHLMAL